MHRTPSPERSTSRTSHSPLERLSSIRSLDPEQFEPPRPPSPRPPEENAPPPFEEVTHLRLAAHYAVLVLASMIGTLMRLGLEALGTYDGEVIYSLAWAQGVGCGIMGLALARKNQIVWIYPPLYTFFTTGVAGSLTTFSSWMLEGYEAFANFDNYDRSGLYDTVNGLAYSFSTFAIAYACLHLGEHMSRVLPNLPHPPNRRALSKRKENGAPAESSESSDSPSSPPDSSTSSHGLRTPIVDAITLVIAALTYLIALILYFYAPSSWRHRAIFAILLSPPGAIIRFLFARLNTRALFVDRFPLGTFIVNIAATLVIAGSFAAQLMPRSVLACNALYGLEEGFCGCLSTVSTFVVEARAIRGLKWKWIYVFGSVILGQVLVLAIVGGVGWTEGYVNVCTGSD